MIMPMIWARSINIHKLFVVVIVTIILVIVYYPLDADKTRTRTDRIFAVDITILIVILTVLCSTRLVCFTIKDIGRMTNGYYPCEANYI